MNDQQDQAEEVQRFKISRLATRANHFEKWLAIWQFGMEKGLCSGMQQTGKESGQEPCWLSSDSSP